MGNGGIMNTGNEPRLLQGGVGKKKKKEKKENSIRSYPKPDSTPKKNEKVNRGRGSY